MAIEKQVKWVIGIIVATFVAVVIVVSLDTCTGIFTPNAYAGKTEINVKDLDPKENGSIESKIGRPITERIKKVITIPGMFPIWVLNDEIIYNADRAFKYGQACLTCIGDKYEVLGNLDVTGKSHNFMVVKYINTRDIMMDRSDDGSGLSCPTGVITTISTTALYQLQAKRLHQSKYLENLKPKLRKFFAQTKKR
jgi:hypothetical protein